MTKVGMYISSLVLSKQVNNTELAWRQVPWCKQAAPSPAGAACQPDQTQCTGETLVYPACSQS